MFQGRPIPIHAYRLPSVPPAAGASASAASAYPVDTASDTSTASVNATTASLAETTASLAETAASSAGTAASSAGTAASLAETTASSAETAPAGMDASPTAMGVPARLRWNPVPSTDDELHRQRHEDWLAAVITGDVPFMDKYKGNIHGTNASGFNALLLAAGCAQAEALQWCIDHGVGRTSINWATSGSRVTALMLAACKNSVECVRLLIEHGADVRQKDDIGSTALDAAVIGEADDVCAYLISMARCIPGFLDDFPAAHEHAARKGLKMEERMLKVAMTTAADDGDVDTSRPCLVGTKPFGKLAIRTPQIRLRKHVAGGGADVDSDLLQVSLGAYLTSCARRGDLDTLLRFRPHWGYVDEDGCNVVMAACYGRAAHVVQWYLDNTEPTREKRPLLFARDDMGRTCAHHSVAKYNKLRDPDTTDCLQLVVNAGVNPRTVDYSNFSPRDYVLHVGTDTLPRIFAYLNAL